MKERTPAKAKGRAAASPPSWVLLLVPAPCAKTFQLLPRMLLCWAAGTPQTHLCSAEQLHFPVTSPPGHLMKLYSSLYRGKYLAANQLLLRLKRRLRTWTKADPKISTKNSLQFQQLWVVENKTKQKTHTRSPKQTKHKKGRLVGLKRQGYYWCGSTIIKLVFTLSWIKID